MRRKRQLTLRQTSPQIMILPQPLVLSRHRLQGLQGHTMHKRLDQMLLVLRVMRLQVHNVVVIYLSLVPSW